MTVDAKPTALESSFAFYLEGDLNPAQITEETGISPSRTWLAGEAPRRARVYRFPRSGWTVDSGIPKGAELGQHVQAVLAQLRPAWDRLVELSRGNVTGFSGWSYIDGVRGPTATFRPPFDAAFVALSGQLGASIGFNGIWMGKYTVPDLPYVEETEGDDVQVVLTLTGTFKPEQITRETGIAPSRVWTIRSENTNDTSGWEVESPLTFRPAGLEEMVHALMDELRRGWEHLVPMSRHLHAALQIDATMYGGDSPVTFFDGEVVRALAELGASLDLTFRWPAENT